MKSEQLIVFNKVINLHGQFIGEWFNLSEYCWKLDAFSNSPEQFHILANAVNKFYELVAINE